MGNLAGFEKLCFGVPLRLPNAQNQMKLLMLPPHGQGYGVTSKKHLE